jgi:xylitol oxidase
MTMANRSAMRANWADNISFKAARRHFPKTLSELQEIVHGARRVRIVGARHSFNDIADTSGDLVCLAEYVDAPCLDSERAEVTVNAGMTYGELGPWLHHNGFALANMASLPHVTIAGACATATHGSGDEQGNLATAVCALEFVTAEGEVETLRRCSSSDKLEGVAVGLGGFGAITTVTLDVIPTFTMQQEIYAGLGFSELYANFDEIMASAYSVCLFTDWCKGQIDHLRMKHKLTHGHVQGVAGEFFGAKHARLEETRGELSDDWVAKPTGVEGPWYEHLPHFALLKPTAPGYEFQTEYFVPRQHAVEAFRVIEDLHPVFASLITLTEIRSLAADELWMSPSYQQPTIGIHFGWERDWPAVKKMLPILEDALAPFDARPHWGKLFTMTGERLEALYQRMSDFRALLLTYDPSGKFRNAFLERTIFDNP